MCKKGGWVLECDPIQDKGDRGLIAHRVVDTWHESLLAMQMKDTKRSVHQISNIFLIFYNKQEIFYRNLRDGCGYNITVYLQCYPAYHL